jgi:hypothetical protein
MIDSDNDVVWTTDLEELDLALGQTSQARHQRCYVFKGGDMGFPCCCLDVKQDGFGEKLSFNGVLGNPMPAGPRRGSNQWECSNQHIELILFASNLVMLQVS